MGIVAVADLEASAEGVCPRRSPPPDDAPTPPPALAADRIVPPPNGIQSPRSRLQYDRSLSSPGEMRAGDPPSRQAIRDRGTRPPASPAAAPTRKRPRRRAAKCDNEFSSSDVDCHGTLPGGHAHAMKGGYHGLANDEQCFCAAKALRRPCLRWVIRVAPTGSKAAPNVRYAFNSDRICASQRTEADVPEGAVSNAASCTATRSPRRRGRVTRPAPRGRARAPAAMPPPRTRRSDLAPVRLTKLHPLPQARVTA